MLFLQPLLAFGVTQVGSCPFLFASAANNQLVPTHRIQDVQAKIHEILPSNIGSLQRGMPIKTLTPSPHCLDAAFETVVLLLAAQFAIPRSI
jgi:hypothetical protein